MNLRKGIYFRLIAVMLCISLCVQPLSVAAQSVQQVNTLQDETTTTMVEEPDGESVLVQPTTQATVEAPTQETIEAVPEETTEYAPETTVETVPETTVETVPETTVETVPETTTETVPETTTETVPETTTEETVAETTEETTVEMEEIPAYHQGVIRIYHAQQLYAIGSNVPVTDTDEIPDTFGLGSPVMENENPVVYSLNATYQLMNDIPLDEHNLWTLPQGFTGSFLSQPVSDTAPLYDSVSDTIYVYHNYQLLTIVSEQASQEPVMSRDMFPEEFGMGNILYGKATADDSDRLSEEKYLTYSPDHQYVLSSNFTADMPAMIAALIENGTASAEQLGGRSHVGQVFVEIDGEKYILIGNEQQLRAIGTDKQVAPMLFVRTEVDFLIGIFKNITIIPYYPGDADFNLRTFANTGIPYQDIEQETMEFQYFKQEGLDLTQLWGPDFDDPNLVEAVVGILGDVLEGVLSILASADTQLVGLKNTNTIEASIGKEEAGFIPKEAEYMSFSEIQDMYQGLTYSSDQNYIIFRNIDFSQGDYSDGQDQPWPPLHFSGTMEGRLNMVSGDPVTISNICVEQSGELDPTTTSGIGFFGTITNQFNTDTLKSAGTAVVKNVNLNKISVSNQSASVKAVDETLVSGLLDGLSGVLGGILDLTGGLLGALIPGLGDLQLGTLVTGLLQKRASSPDIFATGSFAGRIVGDVSIQNCHVTDAVVTNVMGITGGFVGYTEGMAEYDFLSGTLSGAVKLLATLLNVIPGVGLGDLITVLLDQDVALGELIPIGYQKPVINGCSVAFDANQGTFGNSDKDYCGGFVGVQIATQISNSSVSGLSSVTAKNGAGGFAGIARDAVVNGLLTSTGVELYSFDIQSVQTQCQVSGSGLSVTAAEAYAGGFNGAMANSTSTSCSVSGLSAVSSVKYAGGFTGRATLGYGVTLGSDDDLKNTLLGSLSSLLVDLAAPGNENKLNTLLSLAGLTASKIHGAKVSGTNWTVKATENYAGGLVGQGDGTTIDQNSSASGIALVKADKFAGGIAGSLVVANPIGVLNQTVGVGSYLSFSLCDTTVSGENWQVEATQYAAGGTALAVGGAVDGVTITGLGSVTGGNYAGGFAGLCGSGALVKQTGLDLLGLGLVKVDNLISLVDGTEVTVNNTTVAGTESGFSVQATGVGQQADPADIVAGGFIAQANAIQVEESTVKDLKLVSAAADGEQETYAGGFVGRSYTGGLAGVAQENGDGTLTLPGIVDVRSLVKLVPYLIPQYTNCTAEFVSNGEQPQVSGGYAGGFFGQMESGRVDNSALTDVPYSVYGLEYVQGQSHAGGFAGEIHAGAAASSDGLQLLGGILGLNVSDLLGVLNIYVPKVTAAGVLSAGDGADGFIVKATDDDSCAGGFAGRVSGGEITSSSVKSLKHTKVTPPGDSLESADGRNYFDSDISSYAVTAGRYAGGYIGCGDIDSAARVGGGLNLLGDALQLTDVLQALDVVATKVTDSHVYGCVGGFSVLANGIDSQNNVIGMAGGFAGCGSGIRISNCDVESFAYIVGQEAAGGYAGKIEPGNVASVLDDSGILNGLLNAQENVASLVQSFVPVIEDSQTASIPCGGAVRAQGMTDEMTARGMAGGYVGLNYGGRILGKTRACAVIRLRSVYGGEFAGGFTGLMKTADLASTGNLQILFGLLNTSNVLGLLSVTYPIETNTAVYGPLRQLDLATWNAWAEAVGKDGVYGFQFPTTPVESQEELDALISQYAYGYNVRAGRTTPGSLVFQGGVAGGYVGRMEGGVVTESHGWDSMNISAMESAGGFAGEMITGGAASVGSVSLLGLPINGTLSALQTFVPVVRNADITGYQSGMTVKATGIPQGTDGKVEKVGYAGGFVGRMVGGQIWGNWQSFVKASNDAVPDPNNDRCFVDNLRRVDGTNAVGGFAGAIEPGSAAALDTASSQGLLGGLLQHLISTPGDLLQVLQATMATVRAADVKAWDTYGIIINGSYSNNGITGYANTAGGFAGEITGAVVGERENPESGATVHDLRSVTGGEYAGGFFGLADISAVAEISGDGNTSILGKLLELGAVDVLDGFRTFLYDCQVSGTAQSGLEVSAKQARKLEYVNDPVYTGSAGGFGGSLLSCSVKSSKVTNLRRVNGLNYTGGFIGHLGKSGVIDLDALGVFDDLVNLGAGVLDIFGSYVQDSSVTGLPAGFTVHSQNGATEKSEIAGGFAGYADLAKLDNNTVVNLKQVTSNEIAGGFVGKTSFAYLLEVEANSQLVNTLVGYLNTVLKALWVADLQQGNILKIDLGAITVDALYDGELVHLNLLGLDISIGLAKEQQLATIYIGDSKIEVNCADDGSITHQDELKNEIQLSLIKANRTRVSDCTVTGISDGYDVYGAGATNTTNGTNANGYAGGFVGFNNEGLLKNNQMYYADVIRGVAGKTGPFTGSSSLVSNWDFNTIYGIEGENNQYRIYRNVDSSYYQILRSDGELLDCTLSSDEVWSNIYTVTHLAENQVQKFTDLKDAVMSNDMDTTLLNAYLENGAMAVLMGNIPSQPTEPGEEQEPPDAQDPCEDIVQLTIRKVWKGDDPEDRPATITLTITRSYTNANGEVVQDTGFQETITMSAEDYETEDTWQRILTGSQYTAYFVAEDGSKYYYTYYISEEPIDWYDTEITYSGQYHYNMVITNTMQWLGSILPGTGGTGTQLYTLTGLLLMAAAVWYGRRPRRRKGVFER